MYLSSATIVPYLIDRGILTGAEVANDDIVVLEAGRRNRNFKVLQRNAPGLFLKQIPMIVPETVQSLKREADLLTCSKTNPHFAGIKDLTPILRHYDPERHMLIMELVPDSLSLTDFHTQYSTVAGVAEALAGQIGRILASCHMKTAPQQAEAEGIHIFNRTRPWIFSLIDAGENMMPNMAQGNHQILDQMRRMPGLQQHFQALRQGWQQTTLIHGDIKWENFLITMPEGTPQSAKLQLIDWELADIGDPCWDTGAVLAGYVLPVVAGVAHTDTGKRDHPLDPYQYTLAQACSRAFWKSYREACSFSAEQSRIVLWRSVCFAAARLILTAYEMTQGQNQASPEALQAVQVGSAMLNDPQTAMQSFFTLSPEM